MKHPFISRLNKHLFAPCDRYRDHCHLTINIFYPFYIQFHSSTRCFQNPGAAKVITFIFKWLPVSVEKAPDTVVLFFMTWQGPILYVSIFNHQGKSDIINMCLLSKNSCRFMVNHTFQKICEVFCISFWNTILGSVASHMRLHTCRKSLITFQYLSCLFIKFC